MAKYTQEVNRHPGSETCLIRGIREDCKILGRGTLRCFEEFIILYITGNQKGEAIPLKQRFKRKSVTNQVLVLSF